MKKVSVQTAEDRLITLTGQLTGMFQQSAAPLSVHTLSIAGKKEIHNFLLDSSSQDNRSGAQKALEQITTDSLTPLVQLYNKEKQAILNHEHSGFKLNGRLDPLFKNMSLPSSPYVGNIVLSGDSMYYPIVAAVKDSAQVIGYVVRWRWLYATPKGIEALSQLIGTNAGLYFGNTDRRFWTDLVKPVPAPSVKNFVIAKPMHYQRNNRAVIAATQAVPGTNWMILVEFAEDPIIAGAQSFLYAMLGIGLVLLLAGIVVTWLVGRNISRPLHHLMEATTAIAAGKQAALIFVKRRDEVGKLAQAFNSMAFQIQSAQQDLEKKVEQRTSQLENANKELEAFSYSVSHDLRAPLRAVSGYARILEEDYGAKLDHDANRVISNIMSNAKMMGQLIDDLIEFSRMGKKEISQQSIDMDGLAHTCLTELLQNENPSAFEAHIDKLPTSPGDPSMLKQVWLNLISNAIKYSSKQKTPKVEIGYQGDDSMNIYYIRDNGVGFNMDYAHKLFGVFQRLHSQEEFEGTGVGLALTKRIIHKHHGEIWAEATTGRGATFYFSLPKHTTNEF
jgi:signal transduction histidine kinase